MKDLGLNEAPGGPRSRRTGDKSSKVRKSDAKCCNVDAIIGTMLVEQREHNFSKFGDAYIRDRKVVASWMIDVCEYFSLHPTTIHGAISYLDRLQPSDKHSRYEWKMFVVCCILISAKYNESETDVPDLETLEYLIQLPIPKDTLLNYELWTLQKLGWKLNVRSPLAFIACFVVCGVAFPSDECWDADHKYLLTCHDLDRQITEECYAMASFALLEAPLKSHKASDVACGILYFVRRALGVSPVWVPELTALTRTCPSSAEVVAVLDAFDRLLLTSSHQDPTGEEVEAEVEREVESVTRDMMGSAVSQVTTPASGRCANERSEMDSLLHQIASVSLGAAEGRDRDQSPLGFEGQSTPEEKASRFSKGQGLVYPSPVSILAVESLEHFP